METRHLLEIAEEHRFLVSRFFELHARDLLRAGEVLVRCLRGDGKILLFGNGGSAADAQHIAAELSGRFQVERAGLPAIALTTDTSALTAIANDYGYDLVFARQVEALGRRGDVAVGISTSGRSRNVLAGLRAARDRGLTTVGLLGRDGGTIREACDHPLVVPGEKTARIQEVHILVGHVLCEIVERALFRGQP